MGLFHIERLTVGPIGLGGGVCTRTVGAEDRLNIYIYIYIYTHTPDNDKDILASLNRRVFWIDVPVSMCPLFVGFC
jgi:hypothetical protein